MSTETIWYTRCPVPTAFSIAVRKGWLDDELSEDGIAVESLAISADPSVRQSHFDQTQPNFFRQGGNIPPIVSRSRGTDVRVIGLGWSDWSEPLLTLPASGIETLADLQGRRLALPRRVNDSVDFWRATVLRGYQTAFQIAGLQPEDVEFVDVLVDRTFVDDSTETTARRATLWDATYMLGHQREEGVALLRGDVDVVFSHGASAVNLKAFTGARTLIDLGTLPQRSLRVNNSVPNTLTVTGDLLDQRPDLVARVLARTLEAADWANANPLDARRIVAAEVGSAEELVDLAYSPALSQQLDVSLDGDRLAGLASQVQLLARHGFLAGEVDLDAFVDHEPLAEARRLLAATEPVVAGAV
jgi:ABC-type nitrate/sulfonate/bicarbonate transport system substrate-binding protein